MCVIACNYTGILKLYTKIMNIPIARHNLIYNDSLPQCYGRGLYFMAAVTVPPLILSAMWLATMFLDVLQLVFQVDLQLCFRAALQLCCKVAYSFVIRLLVAML